MAPRSALVGFVTLLSTTDASSTAGTFPFTGALADTGCFAPKSSGSWGFCGPASCNKAYATCPGEGGGPPTVGGVTGSYISQGPQQLSPTNCDSFIPRTNTPDYSTLDIFTPHGPCSATCTQNRTGFCSAAFLANAIQGPGVKNAYCNDKWLVIHADGSPGVFAPNLNDVPFPPAGGSGAQHMRTGMATLDLTRADALYFPLHVEELATSLGENNIAVWDSVTYLVDKAGNKFGIPANGGIGMGVNGQSIFPMYNNNGQYTPAKCEVDSCQEHVGQGGGQPHLHGDPFSSNESVYRCLYGVGNYSSVKAHPPLIGFAGDGYLIYGRYLSNEAPGFAAPLLDACGGHKHTSAMDIDEHGLNLHDNYHYHTQVFDAMCGPGDMCTSGELYKVSSTGPLRCYKADLSKQEGGSALLGATRSSNYKTQDQMGYACCGMTDYYALTGATFPAGYLDVSSSCAPPSAPANGQWPVNSACGGTAKLLSGYQCTPQCNTGYSVVGTTRCVKGSIVESAACVAKANAADVSQYQGGTTDVTTTSTKGDNSAQASGQGGTTDVTTTSTKGANSAQASGQGGTTDGTITSTKGANSPQVDGPGVTTGGTTNATKVANSAQASGTDRCLVKGAVIVVLFAFLQRTQ